MDDIKLATSISQIISRFRPDFYQLLWQRPFWKSLLRSPQTHIVLWTRAQEDVICNATLHSFKWAFRKFDLSPTTAIVAKNPVTLQLFDFQTGGKEFDELFNQWQEQDVGWRLFLLHPFDLLVKDRKQTETLLCSAASFYPTQSDNFLILINSCKCKYFQGLLKYDVDITTTVKDINKKPSEVKCSMIEMHVCQKWRRYLENACVSVRTTSIHSHRSWSLPPSWHLRTDRQTDNVAGGTKEGKKSGFLRAAAATAATATAELV